MTYSVGITRVRISLQHSTSFICAFFLRQAGPSYLLILILQLRLLWRIWDLKDITPGDTSSYFANAYYWFDSFRENVAWSPLYTAFYGSFLFITEDPYAATILHRLAIVLLSTVLVLFLLRSILPPALALLGAAWWAAVPTYYNSLYEVHLFALLPVLWAWTLILRCDSPWARGTAVAVLAASTVLVRNEFGVAAVLTVLMCLWYEYYQAVGGSPVTRRLAAYTIPFGCAALLCVVTYWRSVVHFPELSIGLQDKHTINMCQVFAFGFQQRSSAWAGNPWFDCQSLMQQTFGKGLPSFAEMLSANPTAVVKHLLWNLSLIPNGLELLLFGAMHGHANPDYIPVMRARYPLFLLLILITAPLAAACEARHGFYKRIAQWMRNRTRLLIAFLPMLAMAFIVALVQRPRPSYLLYVTVILIVLFMESISALLRGRPGWSRALEVIAPIVVLLLIIGVSSYYVEHPSARPLKDKIERLASQREAMAAANGRLLLGSYASETAAYLRLPQTAPDPRYNRPGVLDNAALQQWDRSIALENWLSNEQIQFAYFDPVVLNELRKSPAANSLLSDPTSIGWKLLAYSNQGDNSWIFLTQVEAQSLEEGKWVTGAYPIEVFRGQSFQWLKKSANLELRPGAECVAFRIFGTGRSDPSQTIRITGKNITPVEVNIAGTNVANPREMRIPLANSDVASLLTFEADIPEDTFPGDTRTIALGATTPKGRSGRDCQ
jgi:hypothetical protein